MTWLRRIGRASPPASEAAGERVPRSTERASPGIAALLEGIAEDRSHSVLDLGPAAEHSLRVYSRFARRIRFAGLLDSLSEGWEAARSTVPPQPEAPYDLLFGWDVLGRLPPDVRPSLVDWLAEVSAPNARLHVVLAAPEVTEIHPYRFSLLEVDRIRCDPTGPARPAPSHLLPAEVEKLLMPFHVTRAFTLKGGLREYVAVRRTPEAGGY